ncbi:MAG: hypothetical protein AB1453_14735 [Chloroflexota bacterium]
MKKNGYIASRIDEQDQHKFDYMCRVTVRSKSDMLRYIIQRQYDALVNEGEIPPLPQPQVNFQEA